MLGGYGGFGGRLSRRLAEAGHEVVVAGRRLSEATRFCSGLPGCRPLVADRNGELTALFATERPALVIDAAGPFQDSGYRVPKACAALNIPYLDLADDRAFVSGIGTLRADVPMISGASSVPALSAAVARHLAAGMSRVTAVEAAISASNQAAAGRSVATAILSSVGQPVPLRRGGRASTGYGWQDMRREHFDFADGTSLGRRWVAIADVPDLSLLPKRMVGRPAVTFRAGTELGFQNLALWLVSWPVRWFGVSLRPLARWLLPLQRLTAALGSDRSGMVVRVFGVATGRRVERRWTLIAEKGDGPEIPTLAAAILAERILAGACSPGPRDAGEALSIADFQPDFMRLAIRHETREIGQPDPLYRQVMGSEFDRLCPAVRGLHDVLRDGGASGHATVTRGGHPVARLIAAAVGFPPAGEHALHVSFSEQDGEETWTRDFAGRRFRSRMSQRGQELVERFGPLRFRFVLIREGRGLRMVMRGWSCFGVPLPLALAPRSDARETEDAQGRFSFDVPITLPLVGLIVHYQGWLTPPNGS
ncbi:SDR family oxidoreductase [Sphingomonas rubra]|uniref:Saccharopine dehydrogenase, NADP-dependent n=1 Tax=Sphingomonas rubra TaxID=634430 RepID=A0A1I5TGZ1_9SPHN|nr:SDR family oxidoreductase [Sphingomonas rubra]SFP81937.1 Saccharopine dehydrogenase, NADP-dependent [Sphingomonas rubra]